MSFIDAVKREKICHVGWIFACFFCTVVLSPVSAQKFDRSSASLARLFAPPNGHYLYDSIFIDETEICNIHWLEYLFHIKMDSSESFYISQLPDTACWNSYLTAADSSDLLNEDDYLRYPGTRYFPVVGVSYEQAMNYCRWRGSSVTAFYADPANIKKHPGLKDFEIVVTFRLPTKEEWEFAAAGGLDRRSVPYGIQQPWKGKRYNGGSKRPSPECLDRSGVLAAGKPVIHRVEFNVLEDFYIENGGPLIICSQRKAQDIGYIYDYPPNGYWLYNMIGNVAEMTLTKGIAKGGSFEHRLQECAIEKDFLYDNPEEWLGFRCVAEVHCKKRRVPAVQSAR
jgi:formylglycine-generating enzyme required for sulfatase activity